MVVAVCHGGVTNAYICWECDFSILKEEFSTGHSQFKRQGEVKPAKSNNQAVFILCMAYLCRLNFGKNFFVLSVLFCKLC